MDSQTLLNTALKVLITTNLGEQPSVADLDVLRRHTPLSLQDLSVDHLACETVYRETARELEHSRQARLASHRFMRRKRSE